MKLRYIFATILAALCFAGCQDEAALGHLKNVQVSESFVALPFDGGSQEITVTASQLWEFTGVPEWLTVDPAEGNEGEHVVTFSAEAASDAREAVLTLECAGEEQTIIVQQKTDEQPPVMTVKEARATIISWGKDGTGSIAVKGYIISINDVSPQYGNATYTIADKPSGYTEDETLYIYRGYYLDGEKFTKEDQIGLGDLVTIVGPASYYKGTTPEMTQYNKITELVPSLISLDEVTPAEALPIEGGQVVAKLTTKGGIKVGIPEEAKSWLSLVSVDIKDTEATVVLNAAENAGGDRSVVVTFSTADGAGATSTTVAQKGSALTFDQFVALEKDALGTIEGIVTGVHKKGFVISDENKKALYVYVNSLPEVSIGDKVLVTGKKGAFRQCYQVAEPTYTVISSGNEVSYPTPAQCTDELWTEMSADANAVFTAKYVKVSGKHEGDYGDVPFGDNGCKVSPYQTSENFNYPSAFKDKAVTIIGYVLQVYTEEGAKQFRILPVSIAEATEEDFAEPTYTSVAELTALVKGGATEYNVNVKDAVVTYVNGRNAFIEDATGGILLYADGHGLEAGNKITGPVSGDNVEVYNNLPELKAMDYSGASVKTGAEIPCTELTLAQLLENYDRYISCRVLLKGVTVTDGLNLDDRDGTIKQGESEVALRSQDKLTVVVEANKVGDLICYPTVYKDKKQVGIWQNDHFTVSGEGGGEEGGEETPDEPDPVVEMTIAEAKELTEGAEVALGEVTVVGAYNKGFLAMDETGYLLIYENKTATVKVGDAVKVTGSMGAYGGLPQVKNPVVTLVREGSYTQPTPEVLDGAAVDALIAAPVVKYVQYKGVLSISGNYYNVKIDGATAVGSIQYPISGAVNAELNGKTVIVTGYFVGVSGSSTKYFNTMLVEVSEDTTVPFLSVDKTSLSFTAEGGSAEVAVVVENTTEAVVPTVDNAHFTAAYANNVVTVTAPANETAEAITGTLTISVAGLTKTVALSQAAKPAEGGDAANEKVLTFNFSSAVEGWPTGSPNPGTYPYTLDGVDYSFVLTGDVYYNTQKYLMVKKKASVGLPAIEGYKLTKVVGQLNDAGSPSTKSVVSISSDPEGTTVIAGGDGQKWSEMGGEYTYTLTATVANTMYYMYVDNSANSQWIKIVLTYEKL